MLQTLEKTPPKHANGKHRAAAASKMATAWNLFSTNEPVRSLRAVNEVKFAGLNYDLL